MKQNARIINKFEYYLEDCDCQYCSNYLGRKFGCKLYQCPFEDIKQDAIRHGRIKRKKGWEKWDG
jgi:hypothetical protein